MHLKSYVDDYTTNFQNVKPQFLFLLALIVKKDNTPIISKSQEGFAFSLLGEDFGSSKITYIQKNKKYKKSFENSNILELYLSNPQLFKFDFY